MSNPTSESFVRDLRRALYQLYDPADLRKNPLAAILPTRRGEDPSVSLRRVLLEAIAALKPDAKVPVQSNAWRVYSILSQRFVEQFSQREVATDLALSIRQLRRHETLALNVLANYLRAHYLQDSTPAADAPEQRDVMGAPAVAEAPSRAEELAWLGKSVPGEVVHVGKVITSVIEVVAPLARSCGVSIVPAAARGLPRLDVRLGPMRQALLAVLTAAIKSVPGGQVTVQARRSGRTVCISIESSIRSAPPDRPCPPAPDGLSGEDWAMARQLTTLAGGSLEVVASDGQNRPFAANLLFAVTEKLDVLVIDDNADALRLMESYLAGTRYHCVAASDVERALALAAQRVPQAIVLDVMLPNIDGWELLGRLRTHPKTHGVPIIICTILPQEQLALALGASAFIRKPVARANLLAVLGRLVAGPSKGLPSGPRYRPGADA